MGEARRRLEWGELDRSLMLDEDPDFPTPVLNDKMVPAVILECAGDISDLQNCPIDYAVGVILGAASGLIGSTRRIVTLSGWKLNPILWIISVGLSGNRKSPPLRFLKEEVMVPLQREAEKKWREQRGGDYDDEHPMSLMFSDVTIEGVREEQSRNPYGMLGTYDEANGWFSSFNQYKGGRGSDESKWLSMRDGGTDFIHRKGKKRVDIPYIGAAIIGNIIPRVGFEVILRSNGNGMAERIVYIYPNKRTPRMIEEISDRQVSSLVRELKRAFRKLLLLRDGEGNTAGDGDWRPFAPGAGPGGHQVNPSGVGEISSHRLRISKPRRRRGFHQWMGEQSPRTDFAASTGVQAARVGAD
jgi:Protein of unknown function (DUF3987)